MADKSDQQSLSTLCQFIVSAFKPHLGMSAIAIRFVGGMATAAQSSPHHFIGCTARAAHHFKIATHYQWAIFSKRDVQWAIALVQCLEHLRCWLARSEETGSRVAAIAEGFVLRLPTAA